MFKFTDSERFALKESRALSTDDQGNEVLVGLTLDETRELIEHRRKFIDAINGHGERERDRAKVKHCAALNERHKLAVAAIGVAGHQLKIDKPTLQ